MILASSFSSCFWHHHHDSCVSISDNGDDYEMYASFDRAKTRKIQRLVDRELNIELDRSGRNGRIDDVIRLDDQTSFHMRSYPGEIRINVDRSQISDESWEKIQNLCEDIKEELAGRE